jgi:two-component system cell cycle response regulator
MRALIADDDPVNRRLLQALLTKWDYEISVAADGATAWQMLQADGAPRLALLDWMMPGMDGVEVCRRIRSRQDGAYTYVLLLTARDGHRDVLEGLEAGADDYLTKPFDPEELRVRLRTGKRILDLENRLLAAQVSLAFEAAHDSLTELWNHRAILESLQRELVRAAREHTSLGVVLLDVDHFKQVNDRHGHLAGDDVLREVSRRMQASVRSYDGVGRYGGEEFLVILPTCSAAEALEKAEQIRRVIADQPFQTCDGPLRITASLGALGSAAGLYQDPSALLQAVDAALYRAKDAGRNCVKAAPLPGVECESGPHEASGLLR